MATTPLRQLIGGRYPVKQLFVEVLECVGFPVFKNALPFLLLKQSTLLSGTLRGVLFLRQVWRFMLAAKNMPCFWFQKTTGVLSNIRRTRPQTHI